MGLHALIDFIFNFLSVFSVSSVALFSSGRHLPGLRP